MTQYFPSKIRHIFDPEKGLVQEIGDPSTVTFASGTIIEVSGVFAYVPEDPSQWAAVPTNLIQAVDYLAAGSGSGGGGGGGTINGSIEVNEIAFGTATGVISGSGNLSYNPSTKTVSLTGDANPVLSLVDEISATPFLEITPSTREVAMSDPSIPTNTTVISTTDVAISDGVGTGNVSALSMGVTDTASTNKITLSSPSGEATLKADNSAGTLVELHLSASSLTMQSSVASGDFLTIDSNTQRLTVVDPGTGIDLVYLEGGRATIDAAGNTLSFDAFTVPTITTLNVGSSLPMPLNLSIEALQINSDPGTAGYVLTSSGPGAPPGWALASFGGGSTIFTGSLMFYVDSVGGTDSPGNGTLSSPFRTINYAYSQVPSLGNIANTGSNASTDQFVREKLIFKLAPGRYTENVTLGFKRARVALVGNGVQIIGNVKMSVVRGDFPAASMEAIKGTFPSPWTSGSSQNTFEIVGENGAGVESDASSNSILITGLTSFAFEDATMPGSGLGTNWENNYGQFNFYANKCNLIGGMVMATNYTVPTTNGICTSVIEVDSCTIGESASPIRTYFGVVPYAYLAAPLTWNTGSVGTTNKAPTGTITCKVHNSTIGAAIGPRLVIGEMDGNRIYDIDRTMLGTVDNGAVAGSTSTSYIGFVNNQFRVYSGAGIPTSSYQLGQATGTTRYKLDSVSYTTLAFSRSGAGVLTPRTLNTGSGVSYDFLDEARSLAYTPVSAAFWAAPAPTTIQNAVDRLSVAVRGLLTASIPA
jgi:hypothetical protein